MNSFDFDLINFLKIEVMIPKQVPPLTCFRNIVTQMYENETEKTTTLY